MITIKLNGEEKEINDNLTIQDLLDQIGNKSKMLVVERNLEIVPKDQYSYCIIQDKDKIEIVSFVGGG